MKAFAAVLAAVLIATPVVARDGALSFSAARVRAGGLGAIASVDIRNDGPADRLVGVRCVCDQPAELHIAHVRHDSDILAHATLGSINIPTRQTTVLAYFASHHGGGDAIVPGEFILVLNPSKLDRSRDLTLILTFEHAGERTISFPWTLARD